MVMYYSNYSIIVRTNYVIFTFCKYLTEDQLIGDPSVLLCLIGIEACAYSGEAT